MYKYKNNRAFTLIELLIVIAIIGVISSIVLSSLNTSRNRANDAKRISSIKQVQTALEAYYNDNNSQYPTSADVAFPGILSSALTPGYISSIPSDPNPSTPFRYYTASQNPAQFYAILIQYQTKPSCYVCGGSLCAANMSWWGVNMC